jgi:hypothetical protein
MSQFDESFYRKVFERAGQYQGFLEKAARKETTEVKRLQSDTGFSSTQVKEIIDLLEDEDILRNTEVVCGGERGYSETVEALEIPEYTREALKYDDEQRYVKNMIDRESR